MNAFLRNYATPLSIVTGLAVSVTGLMMFFGIRGEIGDIHEWIGIAFVIALLMHAIRNWPGVKKIMSTVPGKAIVGVLGAAAIALIVTSLPAGGQHDAPQGGPWAIVNRVAEAPISASAPALGMSSDDMIAKLKAKGLAVEGSHQSLSDIARKHNIEARRLVFGLIQHEG